MKTTGYFVSSTAEFTTCMQNGKYYFNSRNACFMINTYRYTTSIINNSNGIVLINGDINRITKSCKCLIYGIIYNFINQMMKTSACCGTDVHTGSLSNSLKTFQNLNLVGAIFMFNCCIVHGFFAHDFLISAF